MRKISLIGILFFYMALANAETITAICPSAEQMNPPTKGTIYANKFTGSTPINLPEINNTLVLSGEASSTKALAFYTATWTDHTFLCLYKGNYDDIVSYEIVLWQYVKRCWFKATGYSECESDDPAKCQLTCELGHSDDYKSPPLKKGD